MTIGFPQRPDLAELPPRSAAKMQRRYDLLQSAVIIMADKGFHSMRLEDLGEAVGISAPAVYRHFPSKEEILHELLIGISEYLLEEAQKILDGIEGARDRVEVLIDFHVTFALAQPEMIKLHQRELFRLDERGLERVRAAQGKYLALWADALAGFSSAYEGESGKITAQLITGMLNASQNTGRWAGQSLLRRQMTLCARGMVGLR